jgi:tetratricopeptide (TPR) repeat protein
VRPLLPAVLLIALNASAQYVPPVPKTITGERALNRRGDIPLPSSKQQWIRAKSAHFVTLSGASPRRTQQIIDQLETAAAALRQIDPIFAAEGEPIRLILFARSRDAAPYFDLLLGNRSAGVFLVGPDGSGTMLVDASRPFADRTVLHELVHNLLANSGTHLPLWLEEGLAEYYSTAVVSGNAVHFGDPIADRLSTLHSRPLIPVTDVFEMKAGSELSSSAFFYAEAWAIVDWMMRADRSAFFAFLHDVERGGPPADAFRRHFQIDVAVMQRSLEVPLHRPPAIASIRVPVAVQPEVSAPQPLTREDVILDLAELLGSFEATRQDAERFLESVAQPNARAVAALASFRARDKRYDEAARLYEQALKIDPNDPAIRLSFAESLLGNALGPFTGTTDIEPSDAPRFRRARQLAKEALTAGSDSSRAHAVIGTSYLVEQDVKPGIEALQRARAESPTRYDVALNLYALLLRDGRRDEAEHLYRDISAQAKTPQAIFAARTVVVREQLALANRLLAQSRVEEAIAVIEQLMAATPDPSAKADLARQLMHLHEVSGANRQINAYNDAVRAANAGETKKAIEILDRLLEGATDESVIHDAQEFRKVLEKRLAGMRRSRGSL